MRSLLMLLILMSIVVLARGQCPTEGKKFIPGVSMEVNTHPGFLVQAGVVGLQQPFSVFFGIEGKANEQPDKTGMKDDNPKVFPRLEILCRIIPGLHAYAGHDTQNIDVGMIGHIGNGPTVLRLRAGYNREFVAALGITFVIY